jgi:hypothetical protein
VRLCVWGEGDVKGDGRGAFVKDRGAQECDQRCTWACALMMAEKKDTSLVSLRCSNLKKELRHLSMVGQMNKQISDEDAHESGSSELHTSCTTVHPSRDATRRHSATDSSYLKCKIVANACLCKTKNK